MDITASVTASQLTVSQQTIEATAVSQSSPTMQQALHGKDRLDISDEAKVHSHKGHSAQGLQNRNDTDGNRMLLSFLRDLLQVLTGKETDRLETLPDEADSGLPLQTLNLPAQTVSGELQQTSLSVEMQSFSFSGTAQTRDGQELAFSLELQSTHASFSNQFASFQSGPQGSSFNFAGTAAEMTSTSFTFSLATSDPVDDGVHGRGRFHLNDELSAVGKALKPMIKEALGEQAWSETNKLLRTIA